MGYTTSTIGFPITTVTQTVPSDQTAISFSTDLDAKVAVFIQVAPSDATREDGAALASRQMGVFAPPTMQLTS